MLFLIGWGLSEIAFRQDWFPWLIHIGYLDGFPISTGWQVAGAVRVGFFFLEASLAQRRVTVKKLTLVLLGLLFLGCSLNPAQVVEHSGEDLVEATSTVALVEPSRTSTAASTPTESPAPSSPRPSPIQTPGLPTPTPIVYLVRAGDTLAVIADRFQTSIEAIAAENKIVDVNQIAVGQALTIPVGAVAPQQTKAPGAAGTDTPVSAQAVTPDEAVPEVEKNWPGLCHPSLTEEGARVADLPIGESVELTGYLYVKASIFVSNNRYTFTFRPAPYQSYDSETWHSQCTIHARIPRDREGRPNHVKEYGTSFPSVVVLDMNGREIRGWTRIRDSRHVRLKGTVVQPYAMATGLGGSHTIDVTEIELLD